MVVCLYSYLYGAILLQVSSFSLWYVVFFFHDVVDYDYVYSVFRIICELPYILGKNIGLASRCLLYGLEFTLLLFDLMPSRLDNPVFAAIWTLYVMMKRDALPMVLKSEKLNTTLELGTRGIHLLCRYPWHTLSFSLMVESNIETYSSLK